MLSTALPFCGGNREGSSKSEVVGELARNTDLLVPKVHRGKQHHTREDPRTQIHLPLTVEFQGATVERETERQRGPRATVRKPGGDSPAGTQSVS